MCISSKSPFVEITDQNFFVPTPPHHGGNVNFRCQNMKCLLRSPAVRTTERDYMVGDHMTCCHELYLVPCVLSENRRNNAGCVD